MTTAVYNPIENGDPVTTSIAGVTFRAGEKVDITGKTVETIEVEQKETAEGEVRSRGVPKKRTLASVLEKNPYFSVDGKAAPEAPAKKAGRPKQPTTPEEYRVYALRWFEATKDVADLEHRWKAEAEMREKIGVHDDGDDVSYLRPFYEGRHLALRQAEAAEV